MSENKWINKKIKTSSVAKTKKLSIDSIVMVSFSVLRYDCHNIRLSCKY